MSLFLKIYKIKMVAPAPTSLVLRHLLPAAWEMKMPFLRLGKGYE